MVPESWLGTLIIYKIGPLKYGQTHASGPKQMAKILSDQYKSVFCIPRTDMTSLKLKQYDIDMLNDIDITKEDLIAAMKKVNL